MTCVPTVGKFKLINTVADEELEVLSVESLDPKQFHPTIIQPVSLRPTDHLQVTIVFLPLQPGSLATQLKVVTSTGDLYYDLNGQATLNNWGLTDIGAKDLSVRETLSIPISLHNPTEKPVYFEDIFPVESDNTDWASITLAEDDISDIFVGPGVTKVVGKLKVQIDEPGDHFGYMHIRTKANDDPKYFVPAFVVPLSFSVLRPGLFLPEIVDFGILTSPDTVATLPVAMKNVGREHLKVTGFYSTASAVSISSAEDSVIPPKGEKIIWLSYSGKEEGEMEGTLRVISNSSDPRWMEVEAKVKGKIMWGGVGWKESDTWIKVGTDEMWEAKKLMGGQLEGGEQPLFEPTLALLPPKKSHSSKHMIQFANFFKEKVIMNNISTDCGPVITAHGLSLPNEVVGYGESWPPIEYTYSKAAGESGMVGGAGTLQQKGDPLFSCKMRIQTNVSYHDIPMYLYDGKLRVQTDEMLLYDDAAVQDGGDAAGGGYYDNCSSSMDLRDCYPSSLRTDDDPAIAHYLSTIYSDLGDRVKPAVVKFGAVGANEIRTKNLYLTNFNPVPVNVTISVSGLTGLGINLGRVESQIEEIVPLEENAKSLLLSGKSPSYASKVYTYDVGFSERAPQELLEQYDKFSDVSVFNTAGAKNVEEGSLQDLEGYKVDPGEGIKAPKWKNTGGNGVLVSLDGAFEHKLKGDRKKGGDEMVTLPPGGVVRFEVNIVTPPSSVLMNDLTSFLATGLELKTGEGEVIPIAVNYDTVMGSFKLLPFDFHKYYSASRKSDDELFNVDFSPTQYHADLMREYESVAEVDSSGQIIAQPTNRKYYVSGNKKNADVFNFYNYWARTSKTILPRSGENVDVLTISPILKQKQDIDEDFLDPFVDLVLKKGKGRELKVTSIDSCNPLFNVTMMDEKLLKRDLPPVTQDWWNTNPLYDHLKRKNSESVMLDSEEDEELVVVGRLHHRLSCGGTARRYMKPFVFNHLSFWYCAHELITQKSALHKDGCGGIKSKATGDEEIKAEKNADSAIAALLFHQTKVDGNNVISKKQLELWENASEAWATYTDLGLNAMGTSLMPVIPKDSESSKLAMSPLLVNSKLEPPQLLFGKYNEVVFDEVEVGEVAVGYVYLENPTGARLVAALTNEVTDKGSYVQRSKDDSNSWFSARGWSMRSEDPRNSILQVGYGNSIHTQHKKKGWNYAVHGISHLLRGCTRRCGIKQEVTTPVSLFAPISPIVPENEKGRMQAYKVTKPHVFAISYDASTRRIVKPYQIERFGPIFFRPWGPGEFTTDIYIKNDVTLFEKVKLVGRGIVENLEFEGVGEDADELKDIGGMSAMMFPMGLDETRIETGGGKNSTEFDLARRTIRVKNEGETVMKIARWYLSSSWDGATGDYEWGKGWDWKVFWRDEVGCSSRGFKIVGCREGLGGGEGGVQQDVVLRPGESFDVVVEHTPNCVFSTLFAYLVVDISKTRTSMVELMDVEGEYDKVLKQEKWTKKVPLMVGYSASEEEIRQCKVKPGSYRGGSIVHKVAFAAACFALLYWVALQVLNRHDYMLRYEEAYNDTENKAGFQAVKKAMRYIVLSEPSSEMLIARWGGIRKASPLYNNYGVEMFGLELPKEIKGIRQPKYCPGKHVKELIEKRGGREDDEKRSEEAFKKWMEVKNNRERVESGGSAKDVEENDDKDGEEEDREDEDEEEERKKEKEKEKKMEKERERERVKEKDMEKERKKEKDKERLKEKAKEREKERERTKSKEEKEKRRKLAAEQQRIALEAKAMKQKQKEEVEERRKKEKEERKRKEKEEKKEAEARRASLEDEKREKREEWEADRRMKEENKRRLKEERERSKMAEIQAEKDRRKREYNAMEEIKRMEKEVRRAKRDIVGKVGDVIMDAMGVAEVSWLISQSSIKGGTIEDVFKTPEDVARFCHTNTQFDLRTEHGMSFMTLRSVTGDGSGGGVAGGGMGGRMPESVQASPPITTSRPPITTSLRTAGQLELPRPPPGYAPSPSGGGASATASPIGSPMMPSTSMGIGGEGGLKLSPMGLGTIGSAVSSNGGTPVGTPVGGFGGAGVGAVGGGVGRGSGLEAATSLEDLLKPSSVDRLTSQGSDMGGNLDLGGSLNLNDLLPTDIADLIMEGDDEEKVEGEELWGGGDAGGLLKPSDLFYQR